MRTHNLRQIGLVIALGVVVTCRFIPSSSTALPQIVGTASDKATEQKLRKIKTAVLAQDRMIRTIRCTYDLIPVYDKNTRNKSKNEHYVLHSSVTHAEDRPAGLILHDEVYLVGTGVTARSWKAFDGVNSHYVSFRDIKADATNRVTKPGRDRFFSDGRNPLLIVGLRLRWLDQSLAVVLNNAKTITYQGKSKLGDSVCEKIVVSNYFLSGSDTTYRIVVFFDPQHDLLPRRLECWLESEKKPWGYVMETQGFARVTNQLTGKPIWFPNKFTEDVLMGDYDRNLMRCQLESIELNRELNKAIFKSTP